RFVPLGYTGYSPYARLEPGQSFLDEVPSAHHLLPFKGGAEGTLLLCDGEHIEDGLADLSGQIVFSTPSFRVEIRDPADPRSTTNLWPVVSDDARIRTLAEGASVPLLEREGVLLVASEDCGRLIDVLPAHDAVLLRIDAWWREETGARREKGEDVEFAEPTSGTDPEDGARSILAARFWLGRASGARYVFHFREHAGS